LALLLRRIHLLVHWVGLLKAGGRSAEGVLLFFALLLLSTSFEVRLKTHDARVGKVKMDVKPRTANGQLWPSGVRLAQVTSALLVYNLHVGR
jgi:hypothetical protein